jgi:GntR family transcriptional regulator
MFERIDNEELSLKVYKMILRMLKSGELDDYDKLPPEAELASMIGVNRSALREALSNLESDGFITRKRGIGTVINKQVVRTTSRLDLENDFEFMVEEEGYEATSKIVSVDKITWEGEEYLQVKKMIYADGEPAIFMDDRVPLKLVRKDFESMEFEDATIYGFLDRCGVKMPEIVLIDLTPEVGGPVASAMLKIDANQPYLKIVETGYDINQNVVISGTVSMRKDIFNFTILRKRIYWQRVL